MWFKLRAMTGWELLEKHYPTSITQHIDILIQNIDRTYARSLWDRYNVWSSGPALSPALWTSISCMMCHQTFGNCSGTVQNMSHKMSQYVQFHALCVGRVVQRRGGGGKNSFGNVLVNETTFDFFFFSSYSKMQGEKEKNGCRQVEGRSRSLTFLVSALQPEKTWSDWHFDIMICTIPTNNALLVNF